jgi:hypothetical protein
VIRTYVPSIASSVAFASRLLIVWLTASSGLAWASDRAYSPPRMHDGHVDLEGTWALGNATPLERPPQFKTLVITRAEAARISKGRMARLEDRSVITTGSEFYDVLHVEPIRGEFHSSIIVDPADGLIPGTERFHRERAERRKALLTAFDGPEQRPTSERCLQQFNGPAPILVNANISFHQIVQTSGTIVIAGESMHDARIIRMNARHTPAVVVSWLGDSIGWWEGDTLVVETKHFTASSRARATGPNVYFVSPQTIVVERFTRTTDEALHYRFTVSDPAYYAKPWSGENQFVRSTERMYEHACHEGNYALTHILQGARAQEALQSVE